MKDAVDKAPAGFPLSEADWVKAPKGFRRWILGKTRELAGLKRKASELEGRLEARRRSSRLLDPASDSESSRIADVRDTDSTP